MWVGRPKPSRPLVRFEGLPGEFSQHDFGEVDVRFVNGTQRRTHFFASRLKSSRGSEVTLVLDQRVESLVRALVDHFAAIGGVPLLAVFDRPRTVAIAWRRDGVVTEWNPTFAGVALDLGLGIEVFWPYRPQQKGSVENLVGWVKGSFFKQRRYIDDEDLAHAIVDRILERGRLLHLNGSSMRTRHLGLDETTIEALSPQMGGISGTHTAARRFFLRLSLSRSRAPEQAKKQTNDPQTRANTRLRALNAQEAKAGNRANTGGTGKKIPTG